MNNTYVRLSSDEYAARKKENKELQIIRKKELIAKQIIYDLVNNTIAKIITEKRQQQIHIELNTKYIRPKLRFHNGIHLKKQLL